MIAYAWVLAYSIGLISVVCAIVAWRTSRESADGLFALFLGVFLANTIPISAYAFFPDRIGPFSPARFLLIVLALSVSVSLPLYTSVRTGARWMSLVWKMTAVAALLLTGFFAGIFNSGDQARLLAAERGAQVFLSIIIVVAVTPLMRRQPVDVGQVPRKGQRVAGFITIGFAVALLLPLTLEFWGLQLYIDPLLLYLGFYTALSVRFTLLSLPRLHTATYAAHERRETRLNQHGVPPREREVYDLLSKGYTYKEIARLLGISLSTVKTHADHLYRKTKTSNRVELINEIEGA